MPGKTYVLVHGAWAGGWSMGPLATVLRARGDVVHVPTLSGLCERSHLANRAIDLATHVDDVTNEILWNDLGDVVLVGASYAGLVITGVAEKVGDRLASIVYVDAFIPKDGQSFADITGMKPKGDATPSPEMTKDDVPDEAYRAWMAGKPTPQPNGTFTQKLAVSGAYQRVPKKTYVQATGWDGPFKSVVAELRRDPSWTIHEVDCGHDIANLRTAELAVILEKA